MFSFQEGYFTHVLIWRCCCEVETLTPFNLCEEKKRKTPTPFMTTPYILSFIYRGTTAALTLGNADSVWSRTYLPCVRQRTNFYAPLRRKFQWQNTHCLVLSWLDGTTEQRVWHFSFLTRYPAKKLRPTASGTTFLFALYVIKPTQPWKELQPTDNNGFTILPWKRSVVDGWVGNKKDRKCLFCIC